MFNTFNMGVGMSVVVPGSEADRALEILSGRGRGGLSCMGEIVPTARTRVVIC